MRPNKPGLYWWLNNKEKFEIAVVYVDEDELDPVDYLGDMVSRMSVRELEKTTRFKRWVGQAHPPKKVDRYRVFTEEIIGRNYWGDHYSNGHRIGYRRDNTGTWVRYDDVKEYLLGDDDND